VKEEGSGVAKRRRKKIHGNKVSLTSKNQKGKHLLEKPQ